jgi:hypothetical protein
LHTPFKLGAYRHYQIHGLLKSPMKVIADPFTEQRSMDEVLIMALCLHLYVTAVT